MTIILKEQAHKALKLKAIETSGSMSRLINNAFKESIIEDVEDNEASAERANEDPVSYDAMIRKLKTMGVCKIFFKKSVENDLKN